MWFQNTDLLQFLLHVPMIPSALADLCFVTAALILSWECWACLFLDFSFVGTEGEVVNAP